MRFKLMIFCPLWMRHTVAIATVVRHHTPRTAKTLKQGPFASFENVRPTLGPLDSEISIGAVAICASSAVSWSKMHKCCIASMHRD
jgi:hypothetical protein